MAMREARVTPTGTAGVLAFAALPFLLTLASRAPWPFAVNVAAVVLAAAVVVVWRRPMWPVALGLLASLVAYLVFFAWLFDRLATT